MGALYRKILKSFALGKFCPYWRDLFFMHKNPWYSGFGDESPPQAPKFLESAASGGAKPQKIRCVTLPPKAAENFQLPPPLFFQKSVSKGGGSWIH